jgi:hypothetical protein
LVAEALMGSLAMIMLHVLVAASLPQSSSARAANATISVAATQIILDLFKALSRRLLVRE